VFTKNFFEHEINYGLVIIVINIENPTNHLHIFSILDSIDFINRIIKISEVKNGI